MSVEFRGVPEIIAIKFGIITDQHHSNNPSANPDNSVDGTQRLQNFIQMGEENRVRLLCDCGDIAVRNQTLQTHLDYIEDFKNIILNTNTKLDYWIALGNHCYNNNTPQEATFEEIRSALDNNFIGNNNYYYKDYKYVRFIFEDNFKDTPSSWMNQKIQEAEEQGKYVIILAHYPNVFRGGILSFHGHQHSAQGLDTNGAGNHRVNLRSSVINSNDEGSNFSTFGLVTITDKEFTLEGFDLQNSYQENLNIELDKLKPNNYFKENAIMMGGL